MPARSGQYLPILRRARPLTTIDRQSVKPSGETFGPVWTFFDSGTGTITLSGLGVDSYGKTDTGAGTLTLSGAPVFPSTSVLTNFTGTDENPLSEGGAWGGPVESGSSQLKRLSNQGAAAAAGAKSYRVGLSVADQEARLDVPVLPVGSNGVGVMLRVQNPGNTSTAACYIWVYIPSLGFQWYTLTGGHSYTQVGSTTWTSHTLLAGEQIGAKVVGTTLAGYYGVGGVWTNVSGPVTDSTITGAGTIGALLDDTTGRIDNFGGGQVTNPETFGKVFTDSGTGSLTLSGTVAARSQSNADSRTGTLALASGGTSEHNSNAGFSDNPALSIEFTLSGTKTEAASWSDHTTGTITLSGTGAESAGKADARSGSLTLSGTRTESTEIDDSRSGTLSLFMTPISTVAAYPGNFYPGESYPGQFATAAGYPESRLYTDHQTATLTLSGTGTESYTVGGSTNFTDAMSGTITLSGTGGENFGALEASQGLIRLSGHGTETHSGSRGTLTLVPDTEDVLTLVPA